MPTALLVTAIIGTVVAAAAAGYGAYAQRQGQIQQARAASAAAQQQADAEKAAGEARRKQVLYDAKRKAAGIRTREAAAGVQIGEGSLLEGEMQYAADAEYAAQLAQFGYQQSEVAHRYEARLLNRRGVSPAAVGAVAAGSTLATGAGSLASSYYKPQLTQPTVENI